MVRVGDMLVRLLNVIDSFYGRIDRSLEDLELDLGGTRWFVGWRGWALDPGWSERGARVLFDYRYDGSGETLILTKTSIERFGGNESCRAVSGLHQTRLRNSCITQAFW